MDFPGFAPQPGGLYHARMSTQIDSPLLDAAPGGNLAPYTVGELARAVRSLVPMTP